MKQGCFVRTGPLPYEKAWELQRDLFEKRRTGLVPDTLLLTEHPHTFTFGKSGRAENLLVSESVLRRHGIDVFRVDRGGDITYHGPGQLVGYPILDLRQHYRDVGRYLRDLEEVIIRTLEELDINAGRLAGLTGVWVGDAKIAAIGVKVSRWFSMHGFAFNLNTDLEYFSKIVPCGITDKPVTSLRSLLRRQVNLDEIQELVVEKFAEVFGLQLVETALPEVGLDEAFSQSRQTYSKNVVAAD